MGGGKVVWVCCHGSLPCMWCVSRQPGGNGEGDREGRVSFMDLVRLFMVPSHVYQVALDGRGRS